MRNQLFAALLALAACGREGAGVGAGSGSGSDKSNVTVVDPGAEPRTLLTYQIAPHSKESVVVTTSLVGTIAGEKSAFPTMEMDGDVVFGDANKDGVGFTFTTSKLVYQDTPNAMISAAELNPRMKGVTLTVTGTVTPTGHIDDFKLSMSDNAPEALRKGANDLENTYSQMVAELPTVPVGRGAHWQRVVKVQDNGVDAQQTMDFTLVDLQGSKVVVKTAIALDGKPQKIGANELKKFTGKGTYDGTLDLTQMIGASVMTLHVDQELVAMGRDISYSMDTTTTTAPATATAPK